VYRGWIKLWRALHDDPWWRALPHAQKVAWLGLLLEAEWKPAVWVCPVCAAEVTLEPGDTTKSIRYLAERASVSRGVMARLVERCIKAKKVSEIKERFSVTGCHRHLRIKTWGLYQDQDEPVTAPCHPRATDGPLLRSKEPIEVKKKKQRRTAKPMPKGQATLLLEGRPELQATADELRADRRARSGDAIGAARSI
jgi:hypothetical protein